MHIAILTDSLLTGGGLEHIYQLMLGMPHITFTLFAKKGVLPKKFTHLPNLNPFYPTLRPSQVKKVHPDLIHIHHLRPLCRWALLPKKSIEIPILVTMHGLHIRKYLFSKKPLLRVLTKGLFKLRFFLEKHLLKKCHKVIAVSKQDAHFLQTTWGLTNVIWIPNGLCSVCQTPTFQQPPRLFSSRQLIYLTVARFDFQKGQDILLQAIYKIQARCRKENAHFLLIGAGKTEKAMRQLAYKLGIFDLITFLGRQTKGPAWMEQADYFVLPSRWEGLPLTLLEAGMAGLPVIAANTFGINEVICQRQSGLLFETENSADLARALVESFITKKNKAQWSANLKKTLQTQFSSKMMLKKTDLAYKALAKKLY